MVLQFPKVTVTPKTLVGINQFSGGPYLLFLGWGSAESDVPSPKTPAPQLLMVPSPGAHW